MDTLQTKPAYHHPVPWQVVTALALIGLTALVCVGEIVLFGTFYARSADERFERLALLSTLLATVQAIACIVVGAGIAARRDWARRLAVLDGLLVVLYAVMALAILSLLGAFGAAWAASLASGGFSLFMVALLSGDAAQAYTYRGGGGDWPGE